MTRKVRAKAHVPLERLEASPVPPVAAVCVESVPESPDSFVILVSPNPELPVGPFAFAVQVRAVTPNGEVHRCASIEAMGEMQPSTRVFPRLVLLGEHFISERAEADISVRLPANGWGIEHLETDSRDTALARTGADPDGSIKLRVTQQITKIGDQVAQVRIIVRKPNKDIRVLTTEVRYHGVPRPRQSETSTLAPGQP